jgi:pimeloyl-ACP methyl ester carboxylesterase
MTLAAVRDLVGSIFRRPHYSPIVGRPGEAAALTGDDACNGYARLLPQGAQGAQGAKWENKVLSRVFLEAPLYSPIRCAHNVAAPTLIVAGRADTITPAKAAQRAAKRMPNCEFHLIEGNHFELHLQDEPAFVENIALQLAFLGREIGIGQHAAAFSARRKPRKPEACN